jgi:hypothetical protein
MRRITRVEKALDLHRTVLTRWKSRRFSSASSGSNPSHTIIVIALHRFVQFPATDEVVSESVHHCVAAESRTKQLAPSLLFVHIDRRILHTNAKNMRTRADDAHKKKRESAHMQVLKLKTEQSRCGADEGAES